MAKFNNVSDDPFTQEDTIAQFGNLPIKSRLEQVVFFVEYFVKKNVFESALYLVLSEKKEVVDSFVVKTNWYELPKENEIP